MADISKIILPDNNEYEIKDAKARMVILRYGISTWNDFITAYQNNCVMYCRASSNSNPATGSQTRLAFMAYVSNETTPTNVEFQYYRSMSKHTDAQQGDQVFVYKLTNANKWTVTTRNAFSKVIAGTNLTSSFVESETSSSITLSADCDATVTEDSTKLITSGAVYDALSTKSDKIGLNTITGDYSVATFTTDCIAPMSKIVSDINPVQSGTGTPSPQNVRPIIGFSALNVTRTGVNLWNEEWKNGYYSPFNGKFVSMADYICSKNLIRVFPSTQYYVHSDNNILIEVLEYRIDGTYIRRLSSGSANETITTDNDCAYIHIGTHKSGDITTYTSGISINYPSTDTTYHAYNGQTKTVNFGQTVYGGVADVTGGKVTITHKKYLFDNTLSESDIAITLASGYTQISYLPIISVGVGNSPFVSDRFENVPQLQAGLNKVWNSNSETAPRLFFGLPDTVTTKAQAVAWFASNPTEVVYELATPIEITTTPENLTAIVGQNNVYSDTGNLTEIAYFEHVDNNLIKLIKACQL